MDDILEHISIINEEVNELLQELNQKKQKPKSIIDLDYIITRIGYLKDYLILAIQCTSKIAYYIDEQNIIDMVEKVAPKEATKGDKEFVIDEVINKIKYDDLIFNTSIQIINTEIIETFKQIKD